MPDFDPSIEPESGEASALRTGDSAALASDTQSLDSPHTPSPESTEDSAQDLPAGTTAPQEPEPDSPGTAPDAPGSEAYRSRRPLAGAALAGCALGLLGAIFSWYQAVSQAIPSIVQPGEYLNFREQLDGIPVPGLLDWNLSYIQLMLALHDLNSVWRVILATILAILIWIVAVAVLNPTFKLFYLIPRSQNNGKGSASDLSAAATAAVSAAHAETARAATLLLLIGLPLALFWIVAGVAAARISSSHAETVARILRLLSLGIAAWIGFHRNGLAGDLGKAESRWSVRNVLLLIAAGSVFGVVLFAVHRVAALTPLDPVFSRLAALGTFNRSMLTWVTLHHVGAGALMWFAAGSALFAIGRPGVAAPVRGALLALPIVATLLSARVDQPLHMSSMAREFDLTRSVLSHTMRYRQSGRYAVPDGPDAGRTLARLAHIPVGPVRDQPSRPVLLFFQEGVYNVVQRGITEDGLPAAQSTVAPVKSFLDKRHYRTALSWLAIKHLYNVATVHFNPTGAIQWCLDDLKNYPHAAEIDSTLRAALFTCAVTPQNLALLDEWANERQFAFPDRNSIRMMGDLYHRFGAIDRAMSWYRRADMPRSYMAEKRAEKPMFHTGVAQGRLWMNGMPLVGVQVGVVPQRLNGVPPDIAALLLRAAGRELIAGFPYSELFPAFHPRPYSFRWVAAGATTSADGSFRIDGLTDGSYMLVCTLPPDVHLQVPTDRSLSITGTPQGFVTNYEHPRQDFGDVRISVSKSQSNGIDFQKAGSH